MPTIQCHATHDPVQLLAKMSQITQCWIRDYVTVVTMKYRATNISRDYHVLDSPSRQKRRRGGV